MYKPVVAAYKLFHPVTTTHFGYVACKVQLDEGAQFT